MGKVPSHRKLPNPEVLYELVTDRGMSYSEIAMKYGVTKTAVIITLKGDCRRAGRQWPIQREYGTLRERGKDTCYVDSFALKMIVEEFLEDASHLSRTRAAGMLGVSRSTLDRILNETTTRVHVRSAVHIMDALGEPMPDTLAGWVPIRERILLSRDMKRGPQRSENEILDDWEFLRSCGWRGPKIAAKLGYSVEHLQRVMRANREDPRVGDLTWAWIDENKIPLV